MKSYNVAHLGKVENLTREMLMSKIGTTGCEVSINNLPPGFKSPFIHSHKLNEEVFFIIKGSGEFYLDDDSITVKEGSAIKVDPQVKRGFSTKEGMQLICIQAERGSLTQATRDDGVKY